MLNNPQILRMLSKLNQLEKTLEPYIFNKVLTLDCVAYETKERFAYAPESVSYTKMEKGQQWGSELSYCWFKSEFVVPKELNSQDLFIMPDFGSYESFLFVNGKAFGTFANKFTNTGHGNHYCDLLALDAKENTTINIDIEAYAGHFVIGTQPFEEEGSRNFTYTYNGVYVCTKNQDIIDFICDLRTLNQLAESLDNDSFRRAEVINCLTLIHETVYYSPAHVDNEVFLDALKNARAIMKPVLEKTNSDSAPYCGLIGHSHMDTAWLWTIPETIKKCARTFSNQLSLMEQYPEYKFIQSSAYHLEMIRRHYPELFERLQEKVKEGRYEPNGAVWVECDCNITGGEAMVRQFLWGQKYTQKYFDFTSDCFWLPDTFGYSASIPQIMKGCNVDYFLTTKISWNDTNTFPYETFNWEGIDGTNVFCHFNTTHNWPEPTTLIGRTHGYGKGNNIQQKTVSNKRLISYGFGDGGGGPQFEMIEMSKRVKDLEGCPKSSHVLVSDFMKDLEKTAVRPNTFSGELYLELHRGTLTNQHLIKYNNRKGEIALRNLEIVTVSDAVKNKTIASDTNIRPLYETLLVNQFHDILPGTCIPEAHDQSHIEMKGVIENASKLTMQIVKNTDKNGQVSVFNPHSFSYTDTIYFCGEQGYLDTDDTAVSQQIVTLLDGTKALAVSGLVLAPMSSKVFTFTTDVKQKASKFNMDGNVLTTPFAKITFNENGTIKSFIDTTANREIANQNGYSLNTFLMAEDVPSAWDNWDVDADFELKFKDVSNLVSREIVCDGASIFKIRSTYKLTDKTDLKQDMIFYADNPRVDFETIVNWNDMRRFLKVGFDTTILSRVATHDIQFGYVRKPTTRNNSSEQAMFEVVNHKYTDISETSYGVAVLNDCKYGISVKGGDIRLSLHKGGIKPDPRGDQGEHKMTYSFLPHNSSFSAESVIKPSYMLNMPPIISNGSNEVDSLLSSDKANIIVEAIKPCEDNENAFIVRAYEAEGVYTNSVITLGFNAKMVQETNMLEEVLTTLDTSRDIALAFKPFEVKTIKITY